jgi:hypothetical protein
VAETYSGAFFEAVSSERSRGAWLGDMKGHRSVADFVRSVLADRYRTGDHLWLNTGIMEALEELAFTADEAAPSP